MQLVVVKSQKEAEVGNGKFDAGLGQDVISYKHTGTFPRRVIKRLALCTF